MTVLILGAGVAGLTAAHELATAGHGVHIIDKGQGVGGRVATRRIGQARLDHGAQFFTVRGDGFQSLISSAIDQGVVEVWCHGFDGADGHPRYYCPDGMTALAKWMAQSLNSLGVTVDLGQRVERISAADDALRLDLESGHSLRCDHVIVTSPVPQTLDLLDNGGLELDDEQRRQLEAISYLPTIGLLATLDGKPAIDAPGGINNPDGPFSFIADNHLKGISETEAVTFHLNGELSQSKWGDDPDELLDQLKDLAQPWLGSANIVEAQLKKWKFATPKRPHEKRSLTLGHAAENGATIVLAGDAFGGPKVEGAFNSGRDAARKIVESLSS